MRWKGLQYSAYATIKNLTDVLDVDERTCPSIINATLSSDSKNYDLVAYLSSDYSATIKAMLKNTVTQIMGNLSSQQ